MNRVSIVMRRSVLLFSLTAVSFFASAEKFLKPVPAQVTASEQINVPEPVNSAMAPEPAANLNTINLLNTEWTDSGIRDSKNEFSLFFTQTFPKENADRKIQFSFMTQGIGDKKVEFKKEGKPSGIYFNRVVDTWVMDCSDFSGYQLSKTYLMNNNVIYSRKLKLDNYNIDNLEKVSVFPNTDAYNAAKYYCGR